MDDKEFFAWLQFSRIYSEDQRTMEKIMEFPEEQLRELIQTVFDLPESKIRWYLEHREKLAEELVNLRNELRKPKPPMP